MYCNVQDRGSHHKPKSVVHNNVTFLVWGNIFDLWLFESMCVELIPLHILIPILQEIEICFKNCLTCGW